MIDTQAIITKLNTILSSVSNIREVYDGIPPYNAKFPCITIQPQSWEEEYADTRDNIENDVFLITAYIQLDNTRLDSQDKLIGIIKEIREILSDQDNITLDGLIDSSRLTSGTYTFASKESNLYLCEITYNVRKRFNRF